ncbi:hypothetical protein SAMN05421827_11294 [Pedobacter terrae]|uniref:Tetratricopeptide repeat protein n=1 Tax=Pedobacter terrae TaxID=405671 RepID=A0A1G7XUY6_9SPHI|nr:hypothetical protein [Pedobacter terrae]SDG87971.1 hypothetical protein SAMN05421827_11294 [Pedobacter terrae]
MDNKKLLADLLAQPGKVRPEHASMLQEMVKQFPYAQPIHLLLAKANASFIPKAALYGQGHVLFHVLNMVPVEAKQEEGADVNIVVAENIQDEPEVLAQTSEFTDDSPAVMDQVLDVETTNHLPDSNNHFMDLPADDDSFIESVAATDFFAFEQKLSTDVVSTAPEIETVVPDEPERNFVSQYNDDKLPYTFLWWLAKTRKEHEQIFQPYAHPNANNNKPQPQNKPQQESAEFQQQYVEHIFHIQTPFEVADHLAEYPAAEIKDAKGAEIIEKFLKEDPTIKPPKPEQIDNENKAKKSAEDNYDLVSETLAKIYIEQMLYHKAIDTYKKLSLKYPEKSRYFADLIQSIEKKF